MLSVSDKLFLLGCVWLIVSLADSKVVTGCISLVVATAFFTVSYFK